MPGNPFKKPFRGGNTRATPGRPSKPSAKRTFVPTPTSSNGVKGRAVRTPASPGVKVTTKARKSIPMPPVRQGQQMGTPGKTGGSGKPW